MNRLCGARQGAAHFVPPKSEKTPTRAMAESVGSRLIEAGKAMSDDMPATTLPECDKIERVGRRPRAADEVLFRSS